MEKFQHNTNRLLAAAVSLGCAFVATPSFGDFTVTVKGTAVTASNCQAPVVDSLGNITINCAGGVSNPNPPPPPPPPPPTGTISCTNLPGITSTKLIQLPWQRIASVGYSTSKQGGFAPGSAVVFQITPPAGVSTNGGWTTVTLSPTDANSYNNRVAALSRTPCDFSGSLGKRTVVSGQSNFLKFSIGGYPITRMGVPDTSYTNITADGQPYYITVVNQGWSGAGPNGVNTCMSGNCNVDYQLIPGTPGT